MENKIVKINLNYGADSKLESIIVEPCKNCNTGRPEEESMCGSYETR